ncbi:hypothetical protein [Tautonia plasticadhaerens]|uniref:Uncharacterized protein n=1 Tax=Tautonia plasticadhaerens TaxID=2527974 RepID=A0A518HB78_9BACT|nr:hypothetical protein [Tautonia plasticadhaerens]QDV38115.1 hypothetical protein ElP_60640 [Tautonia plasticadhaerens]
MIERLLIPSWNAPPRSVDDWCERLGALGHPPGRSKGGADETWLVIEPLGLRLLAVLEGGTLTALHAELDAPDPGPALALLAEAAPGLDWEVHDEDDDEGEGGRG